MAKQFSTTDVRQWIDVAIGITRRCILVTLLALLAATILRHFGVSLPLRSPDHVTLAYLAGIYWLTK